MSLSRVLGPLGAAAAMSLTLALSGCTGLTPVYGEHGLGAERIALSYGDPASRLDQIVYQELSLRFGADAGPGAPHVQVSTSAGLGIITRSQREIAAIATQEVTVTATAVITDPNGKVAPIVLTRRASAQFTTNNQTLANSSAATEASERAAKAAAESLRLAILGALAGTRG